MNIKRNAERGMRKNNSELRDPSTELGTKSPCKWAEYAGRTSCCGPVYECSNPESPRPRASDKFCRSRCPHREQANGEGGMRNNNSELRDPSSEIGGRV